MQNTKTIKGLAGAMSVSALALGMAIVAPSAMAANGIANTPHNLSPYKGSVGDLTNTSDNPIHVNVAGNTGVTNANLWGNTADVNAEICVFCHTPHGANQSVSAPLWNKKAPTGATYTVYNSGTMNGDTSGGPQAVSLACLSCHDGTQAMDNIINAPGLDGFTPDGGGASGLALNWDNWDGAVGVEVNSDGRMMGNSTNTNYSGSGTIAMLSPDLSNDHPIGMAYCGGGWTATTKETTLAQDTNCADTDFNKASITTRGGSNWFYVETVTDETFGGSANATADHQRDDLRLYGNTNGSATVECGSCHDPHNDVNPTFLRVSNAGSAVCMTCHNK